MKKLVSLAVLTCAILALAACGGGGSNSVTTDPSPQGSELMPGTLSLARMDGLGKRPIFKNVTSVTSSSFDLGTIKASRDFYFILRNTGDFAVTGLQISSSNPSFTVSPSSIDSVNPERTSSIMAVIRVTAVHGVALDGTGYSNSLMALGNNETTISITGKTKNNINDIDVILNVNLGVYAQMMDISLLDGVSEVSLLTPSLYTTSSWGSVPVYTCSTPILKNTGNVDISVTNIMDSPNSPVLESITLHPNDTYTPIYPVNSSWSGKKSVVMKLTSGNTIADYNKLRLQPDGTVCFFIRSW